MAELGMRQSSSSGQCLFCLFMSKLLGDLHIMLGLLESVLKSYHIDCVADPGVDASKLLGISQGFIP